MLQCKLSLDSEFAVSVEVQREESQGSSLRSLFFLEGVSMRRLIFWCLYFCCCVCMCVLFFSALVFHSTSSVLIVFGLICVFKKECMLPCAQVCVYVCF